MPENVVPITNSTTKYEIFFLENLPEIKTYRILGSIAIWKVRLKTSRISGSTVTWELCQILNICGQFYAYILGTQTTNSHKFRVEIVTTLKFWKKSYNTSMCFRFTFTFANINIEYEICRTTLFPHFSTQCRIDQTKLLPEWKKGEYVTCEKGIVE